MSSVIYYFSGTGNSLWVAKKIAASIGDTRLIQIASLMDKKTIFINDDFVGIVTPVYYNGLPEIVERFLKKIKLDNKAYVYSVATLGSTSSSIFNYMDTLLHGRLSYTQHISMAGNYIRMYDIPKEERIKALLVEAEENLVAVISDVQSKKIIPYIKEGFIKKSLFFGVRKIWATKLPSIDKSFKVDGNCTACGLCEKICPVRNIETTTGHPKWNGKCQDCLACINLCPTKSIQIMNKTNNRQRYKNPEIMPSELWRQ